jgi:mevalonate kinase
MSDGQPVVATASACGKVILLGEHAVVYGVPALCGALKRGAEVDVVPGEGRLLVPAWNVRTATADELLQGDGDSSLAQAYAAILRTLPSGLPRPFRFDFVVRFSLPTGAGLGSSAALAVALVRALALVGESGLGRSLTAAEVDAAAFAAEQVFHGQPSGLDHTVAQHGGFGLFRRGQGLSPLSGLGDLPSLPLCIGHTGRARDTKGRVARVAELYRQDEASVRRRFDHIASLVGSAAAAIQRGDLKTLGRAMNENQAELACLDVSCPEIEAMCDLARAAGALGCKLTGGGGGGCVVALAPGREADVAAAWQGAGFTSFLVEVGA